MQISKERLVACSLHRVELKQKGSRVGWVPQLWPVPVQNISWV